MPREENLSPSSRCSFCCHSSLHFFAIGLLAGFADIDAALEESAIFNRNARRYYIASERTVAADIDPVTGREIATNLPEHDDLSRVDVGRYNSIAAYSHAIACQVDGPFHATVDVKRLGTGHFAFDHQRLADRGLVRRRGGGGGGNRTCHRRGFSYLRCCRRRNRALWLTRSGCSRRLICGFPHVAKNPFFS